MTALFAFPLAMFGRTLIMVDSIRTPPDFDIEVTIVVVTRGGGGCVSGATVIVAKGSGVLGDGTSVSIGLVIVV